jgi:hypothetical protein
MKSIVGVLGANVLAWGAVLLATGGSAEAAEAAAPGAAKLEHVAMALGREYIDGPALEAASSAHRSCAADAKGNLYVRAFPTMAIRVVTADGMVRTIAGDDRFLPVTDSCPDEGPASMLPAGYPPTFMIGYGREGANLMVHGLPLEGEDRGCIYIDNIGDYPCRVFKNKEKDNRWWYRFVGKGATPLPTKVGDSVAFKDVDLKGVTLYGEKFVAKGCFYDWDGQDGKIACLLSVADYGEKCLHWKTGKGLGAAEQIVASDDGTMYVLYYGKTYPNGQVFRISKDRSKVEEIVRATNGKDGPGLKSGWHCGPLRIKAAVKDAIVLSSVDSNNVRRWKDGRVATLCEKDGEWREIYGIGRQGVTAKDYCCVPQLGCIYLTYPGEERGGIVHLYRYGPVDFLKPTVGPLAGGE